MTQQNRNTNSTGVATACAMALLTSMCLSSCSTSAPPARQYHQQSQQRQQNMQARQVARPNVNRQAATRSNSGMPSVDEINRTAKNNKLIGTNSYGNDSLDRGAILRAWKDGMLPPDLDNGMKRDWVKVPVKREASPIPVELSNTSIKSPIPNVKTFMITARKGWINDFSYDAVNCATGKYINLYYWDVRNSRWVISNDYTRESNWLPIDKAGSEWREAIRLIKREVCSSKWHEGKRLFTGGKK